MRIAKKKKNCWFLALEPNDDLQLIVEAIARASFEMAKPAGISAITAFDPAVGWESVRTEALRGKKTGGTDPNCLLLMDYVAGRRCKTSIVRGRKYLTVFPGDGREEEMEAMYFLAIKYTLAPEVKTLTALPTLTDSVQ